MASAFDPVKARLVAVVCGGRGADGSLGVDAQARSIPAGRFRKGLRNTPLRDPGYPKAGFDRATRWTWVDDGDEQDPNYEGDSPERHVTRVRLEVGYLTAKGDEHVVKLAGGTGETAAGALADPEARAMTDARRIKRALAWHELVQGGGLDPDIRGVHREGATTTEDLGGGRLVSTTVFVLLLRLDPASNYDW